MANDNPNQPSADSQNGEILDWLMSGKTLTSLDALHQFGCFRLASRISDLRTMGHPIVGEWEKDPFNGKRFKRYSYEQTAKE